MKALRLRQFGRLLLEDMPPPEPAPDEVLVKVLAAGICGTDLKLLHGHHGAYTEGGAELPITPGHEWGGVVVAVGEAVTRFAPGDLVTGETGLGCLRCEYCLTGRHNLCPSVVETGIFGRDGAMRELHLHPEVFTHSAAGLTAEQAALVEPASVAVHACRRGRVSLGDNVAVLGCGPIGLLAVQAARAFGARRVLATSRSRPKLDLASELGAGSVVKVTDEDLSAAAQDFTSGEGFDTVIECSGSPQALEQALEIARPGGTLALVGGYEGPLQHRLIDIVGKELDLAGCRGSPHVWPETIDLLRHGQIKVEPVISHRFALRDYEKAFELAERGGPDVLKILLLPQEV